MKDRLYQILKAKSISASQFADAIGVQRSSVSHVMSGRNKPSMDFMEKILVSFPDINAEWLLTGVGPILREIDLFSAVEQSHRPHKTEGDFRKEKEGQEPAVIQSHDQAGVPDSSEHQSVKPYEKIERIVIFYSNGHFVEYKPDRSVSNR